MRWYRAVALDLDGTLTSGGWPADAVLDQIDRTRADGVRTLLVTGRILNELDIEFPGLADHFDVVVAENGCVLRSGRWTRLLAEPVDGGLLERLHASGLPVRRGEVLLATHGRADHVALDAIESLGLDVQLVRNRDALMLLPPGVTKGTGLREALGELGVSPLSTVAVGDAENDHALLAVAGLGVAVANAVESLRRHADLVLTERDGAGVAALLAGPLMSGEQRMSGRRRLVLGTTTEGRSADIPSAQTSLLVTGGSESGKSYLAGLLVEQLVTQGYQVLVVDPEGDHLPLGALRGVTVLAGPDLPGPAAVPGLVASGGGSVVLDLSQLDDPAREAYLDQLWPAVFAARHETSLPHWLVLEEAQDLRLEQLPGAVLSGLDQGLCLVSYQPDQIPAILLEGVGWRASLSEGGTRQALLIPPEGEPRLFRVGTRTTPHVRHWHKYVDSDLPERQRFTFRQEDGDAQAEAATVRAFLCALGAVPPTVVAFHAGRGDFSRWLGVTYRDHVLASLVATAEHDLIAHGDPERTRRLVLDLVSGGYLPTEQQDQSQRR